MAPTIQTTVPMGTTGLDFCNICTKMLPTLRPHTPCRRLHPPTTCPTEILLTILPWPTRRMRATFKITRRRCISISRTRGALEGRRLSRAKATHFTIGVCCSALPGATGRPGDQAGPGAHLLEQGALSALEDVGRSRFGGGMSVCCDAALAPLGRRPFA